MEEAGGRFGVRTRKIAVIAGVEVPIRQGSSCVHLFILRAENRQNYPSRQTTKPQATTKQTQYHKHNIKTIEDKQGH